jgi:SAM-dependent methyltransferase
MNNQSKPEEALGQMMLGAWFTQALYVAAELGVADVLEEGPATAQELSSALETKEDGLSRVMRALCSAGFFNNDGQGRYSLASMGELLRSDVPGSQRAFARLAGAEFYGSWEGLLESVRTGCQAFRSQYGKNFFDYMAEKPDRWALYDEAMNGIHGPESFPMIEAYDFGHFSSVVDVGGGNGLNLAIILERYQNIKGVLHELPDVAKRAEELFVKKGLTERVYISAGNFFESVPDGGDVYLLRHVIHDWEDEEAVKILRNCRRHMNPRGRVLVAETIIPEGNNPDFVKWLDLMMMVVGGRERTIKEYDTLFTAADLRLTTVIPTKCYSRPQASSTGRKCRLRR